MLTKTKPSDQELAAIREENSRLSGDLLLNPNLVFMDTETTGLPSKDPDTKIVQIAILNTNGKVIFSSLVDPQREIPEEASLVHGIYKETVKGMPTFEELAKNISSILTGKDVVCFNSDFDIALVFNLLDKCGFGRPKLSSSICAMDIYSEWSGEWNQKKKGFKWQKLPNLIGSSAHDAIVDCLNTRQLLIKMSGSAEDPDPSLILDF